MSGDDNRFYSLAKPANVFREVKAPPSFLSSLYSSDGTLSLPYAPLRRGIKFVFNPVRNNAHVLCCSTCRDEVQMKLGQGCDKSALAKNSRFVFRGIKGTRNLR